YVAAARLAVHRLECAAAHQKFRAVFAKHLREGDAVGLIPFRLNDIDAPNPISLRHVVLLVFAFSPPDFSRNQKGPLRKSYCGRVKSLFVDGVLRHWRPTPTEVRRRATSTRRGMPYFQNVVCRSAACCGDGAAPVLFCYPVARWQRKRFERWQRRGFSPWHLGGPRVCEPKRFASSRWGSAVWSLDCCRSSVVSDHLLSPRGARGISLY